jgi:cytochrome c oxidase assembly factor CtaG
MTTWQALRSLWDWESSVLFGCAGLILGYCAVTRRHPSRRAVAVVAGVLVIVVAQCSPLDTLGDTYLFSAHMLQHLLLVLVAPPLLILGLPAWLVEGWLGNRAVAGVERIARQPALAWLLGTGTLSLWHMPPLYNATLAHAGIHIAEHLSFLATATIFWWPVCAARARSRLPHLGAALYLFAAAVASSLLGIILTFAAPGLYPAYLHPADPRGVLALVRAGWGLSPAADQQLGGLCMWVLGGLGYLTAILATLAHWYVGDDAELTPAPAPSLGCFEVPIGTAAMGRGDVGPTSVPAVAAAVTAEFSPSPSPYGTQTYHRPMGDGEGAGGRNDERA